MKEDKVVVEKERLLVLYGSQTGNAVDAADRVAREAERGGCPSVAVLSVDSFPPRCLPDESTVIFIVSTTGQGDVPASMKAFWLFLLQRNLSHQWLQGLRFAVFGLGDSSYQKYNFTAKKLDRRLSDLGAKSIIEKGLGDDQHPSGYEGALDPWLVSLWKLLNQMNPTILPKVSNIQDAHMKKLDRPKFQISYHCVEAKEEFSITPGLKDFEKMVEGARSMSPAKHLYNDNRPHYFLQMVKNQRLNKAGEDRDVRHFEFIASPSEIRYHAGDILEILPSQNSVAVDSFIQRCNLDPNCYIKVQQNADGKQTPYSQVDDLTNFVRLKTFVALTMDIASASPRRYFFEVMSFYATAEHEKERLQYFASPEGRDDLYQYNQKERRTVLEVLEDFPSVQMPFEWLVQLVPPLKTRAFSISCSPLAHPNQVHLTVSIVSWMSPFKRKRHGLCSTWLAGIDPLDSQGVYIPAWINRGTLPSPPPSLPLILIGPGTGCAPFRAFVQERAVQSLNGPTAPVLFFFGCRNEENDFLYREFWLSHTRGSGVLSAEKGGGFFVAFSRDQPQKVYVQHKMKQHSGTIWSLLSAGAAVYVAGSSTKMPADVTSMLEEIVSQESGVSKESAARWLKMQERAGRFHIEAWS